MLIYSQSAHTLSRDTALLSDTGHSGNGDGLNNPDAQCQHNVGPLPRGLYKIGPWQTHPRLGPLSAPLIPQPDAQGSFNWLCGRGGFWLHGPELSDGCVVQLHDIRLALSTAGDQFLEVVH